MVEQKLFMVLIGCRPRGRSIEQHDIFFGVAPALKDLIPSMIAFWPEAKGKIHVDAWREVRYVNGHKISVVPGADKAASAAQLFFINLGGYKPGEFEEYHYKMLTAAPDISTAIQLSKKTAFFKHNGFKGARAHVDDKYGIDVDDIYAVQDMLPGSPQYSIVVESGHNVPDDELNIGYFKLDKL